ncbi:MAG: class I SAM-dependent rRNA methyltransferase [Gammaproteobacteria bacterium]
MYFLAIKEQAALKLRKGYPWIYASAITESTHPSLEPGDLVQVVHHRKRLGIGYYNSKTALACRMLSFDSNATIDETFFKHKFIKALQHRSQYFNLPYYRLVHAEADALPGLVIDRFGSTLVCQTSTAGMEKLKVFWLPALKAVLQPTRIILRDDVPLREKEGLTREVQSYLGSMTDPIEFEENGVHFETNPSDSQKTGWFFDQRDNRRWLAEKSKDKRVLDLYTYMGGFGLSAARKGARQVTLVDASGHALALAQQAAQQNQLATVCDFVQADVFKLLPDYIQAGKQFDILIADPPAFIKQSEHIAAGLRGYQKLARLCAQVVRPGGLFFMASCSHHADHQRFKEVVEAGIAQAGRKANLLRKSGADKDHPVHPLLPESQYLKALTYRL